MKSTAKKIAIVHYWLVSMRGGERVLESLCNIFPDADIFTLVVDNQSISSTIQQHKISTSFLQKIGGAKHYTKMLPLMPFALESLDLTSYDLIISSESGPAKGVIPSPDALHFCYCHSPMRYIWDLQQRYFASSGFFGRLIMQLCFPFLRVWDQCTSQRVDEFIANSVFVKKRIWKYYKRDSVVVNPPVDTSRFSISESPSDYYLYMGQITPYKRVDILLDAFSNSTRKLIVAGNGATSSMKQGATQNIQFIENLTDDAVADLYKNCKALIFPALEDFGIVPLEAQASGRPVIAYGKGGALETVKAGISGVFFADQTPESLNAAVSEFERIEASFVSERIQEHSHIFSKERFESEMKSVLAMFIENHGQSPVSYGLNSHTPQKGSHD